MNIAGSKFKFLDKPSHLTNEVPESPLFFTYANLMLFLRGE